MGELFFGISIYFLGFWRRLVLKVQYAVQQKIYIGSTSEFA